MEHYKVNVKGNENGGPISMVIRHVVSRPALSNSDIVRGICILVIGCVVIGISGILSDFDHLFDGYARTTNLPLALVAWGISGIHISLFSGLTQDVVLAWSGFNPKYLYRVIPMVITIILIITVWSLIP
jgi:hypothetical protein